MFHNLRLSGWQCRLALGALLASFLAMLMAAPPEAARKEAPAPAAKGKIAIKMVTDFESGKLVSDLEDFKPITTLQFDKGGSREVTLGEKCTLWVRNAHIDGKHFFERYYEEKYIGRSSMLELDAAQLGAGEHVIQPGNHRFSLAADGTLTSSDPNIRIDGSTLMLKMHKVTVYAVDGSKSGPADFRMQPAEVGILRLDPDFKLDAKSLPNPRYTHELRKPAFQGKQSPLTNVLSHQKPFYPLTVWLPANQEGQGYLLYPTWQAFHVLPNGKIELSGGGAPRVAGVATEADAVLIPHRKFSGKITSYNRLNAGVGDVAVSSTMNFGATLAPVRFRAGFGKAVPDVFTGLAPLDGVLAFAGQVLPVLPALSLKPAEPFYLPIDNDLTRWPNKHFVADNTTINRDAIRLMALEWQKPIFPRGSEAVVSLRFLESPYAGTLQKPTVRMSWSRYDPSNPVARVWQPVKVLGWTNSRQAGELRFQAPDLAFTFVVLQVQIFDAASPSGDTPFTGEIAGCIIDPKQQGSAAFVSNKGRNAFIAGEDIDLTVVLRSLKPRSPGQRAIILTHPDKYEERLPLDDKGDAWLARSVRLPAARTVNLMPGKYTLSMTDLPGDIVPAPFSFDLVGRQKQSLYHIIKPSKYTGPMNELEPSHLLGKPIDLDRAMRTLADLGYNRVDLMSYMTNHHLRAYTWREELAAGDDRLPPSESVYTPSARDQMLNACVRHQLQYSDIWLSYGDFALPRYIDTYIRASERWMARETQAMRHSPAMDGMILYDEMYDTAAVGFVKELNTLFPKVRARVAEAILGQSPAKIEEAFNRYLQRPRSQRDPKALDMFLKYSDWKQLGWADYIERVVKVGKELAPTARFGTYHRTWLIPGNNDDIYNGYPPDVFKSLDIIGHIHYADNATSWVSIPLLAQALRTGKDKTLYVNMPLLHEIRTQWDGQYQRHMAFALMAEGANGIAHWGLNHTFEDGPNPGTIQARDTTGPLNHEILAPFGEIIDRTAPGYRKVGIVSTLNQHSLGAFKNVPTSHQTEGIWIACWRLGYPASFVREEHLQNKLDGYSVLFVPGIRFDGELSDAIIKRLREAITAGTKVVVESDSILDIPGIIKVDSPLDSYHVGANYFPTWLDDELTKVYSRSQPIVDYLRPKLKEWNVEPAASGPFTVGPNWRDGGQIQYLVMANFEDPNYSHTVRQQMARPVLMPLQVSASRGRVAYDLLAQKEIELKPADDGRKDQTALTVDMRRVQGALVAFLPERIARLEVRHAVSADPGRLRLQADLVGASGKALDAVFPTKITVQGGSQSHTFYRVLGRNLSVELDLPHAAQAVSYKIEVREQISGQTVRFEATGSKFGGPNLELQRDDVPSVPQPAEVQRFVKNVKKAVIVPARAVPGCQELATDLQARLAARGVTARIADESSVYRLPSGDPQAEDPLGDGFHSWHSGQEAIGPAMVVDEDVILMAGRHSSFLLDALADHGYLSIAPVGGPGQPVRPSIQVAAKGLHYAHDTLCLIANDADSMKRNIELLLSDTPGTAGPGRRNGPTYGDAQKVTSDRASAVTPVTSFMGTNELVMDIQFDKSGNLYIITWGHGKNVYSLTPDGKLRFSRHLPEMGANFLSVQDDRVYAYTSAGARLYRMSLDNRPTAQARLNMDIGPASHDDNYSMSHIDCHYIPARRLLLHNMGDKLRLLDDDFKIVAEWHGEKFQDKDVSDEVHERKLHGYALSPDQSRLAQLESSFYFTKAGYMDLEVRDTHLVIRDLQGKLLHEFKNIDNGKEVEARLVWPTAAPGPIVIAKNERWAFGPDLSLLSRSVLPEVELWLGEERYLTRSGKVLVYHDRFGHEQCRIGPMTVMPTFAQLSPDGAWVALLDEYGLLSIAGTKDGALHKSFNLPERGKVLRFAPDSKLLIVGGFRGNVMTFGLDGASKWQTRLGDFNDVLGTDLPLRDPSFPDFTEKLWPVTRDVSGDLDKLVRMDINRLVNGDCESAGGWQGKDLAFHDEGHQSKRSLKVGPDMVGQEVKNFLGKHVTWVLDFHYRAAKRGDSQSELLAGVMTESDDPESVARRFRASDDWQFGRVVIKNGADCRALKVGFVAAGGQVLVDQVQLRRIRFPSVNHMLYEPLYAVKPIIIENPLYLPRYNPFGNLKEQAPNRVLLENTSPGGLPQVDSGFLQNGRLNDVTSNWYNMPPHLGRDPVISLGLKEERWISMAALYFNAYDEANVTPHFDILATDVTAKQDRLVASVRHNGQLMRLVKFPPVKTSLIKVRLVNSIARLRTVTEIELYGPLSGREGTPGFDDPDGQNTYMGDFSRVDRRVRKLPEFFQPPFSKQGGNTDELDWYAPLAQIIVSRDRFYVARTFGKNTAHPVEKPEQDLYWSRPCGLGFTPYGALYGGLLLRCGNDGKLYCLNPDTGTELWSVKLGQRLFGCPVAIDEDVFFTGDGKLFQIDLASGGIMKETPISGTVFGSLATDSKHVFMVSDDGALYAYRAADLALHWKLPIAPDSDSTPAVMDGVVYLADQKGIARAVQVADGKVIWQTPLGDEFTRCPVVTADRVIFGCRGGTLAALQRSDGKPVWSKKVESRFDYEPLALEDRLLYFRDSKAMLVRLSDGNEVPFEIGPAPKGDMKPSRAPFALPRDPIVPISYYKGNLFFIARPGEEHHRDLQVNMPWHVNGGSFTLLRPAAPEITQPAQEKKK